MVESKTITKQLTKFNKILDDLENIEVQLEDEDKVILLLCALPRSFESFKDTMLYGKEGTVTLEEVQPALRTKELTKFKDLRADENNEGLSVSRGNGGGRGNQESSKSGDKAEYKCFKCHKLGHFKLDCPEDNDNSAQVVSEEYEDVGALVMCCWKDEKGDVSHLDLMPCRDVFV